MLTEIKNAIGKKLIGIAKSATGSRMMLAFEDDVKCQLSINLGWDSGDEEIVDDLSFDVWEYHSDDLAEAGAVGPDFLAECERLAKEEQRMAKERQEAEEVKEYERLKKKFESTESPLDSCQAGRDGDCNSDQCPQRRNYKSHCPLPDLIDDEY